MPSTATRLLLKTMGNRGGPTTWASYVASVINPLGWWRFRDASSPSVNSGSLGSAIDGVGTNITYAQTGKLGTSEAVSSNGTTSLVAVPQNAGLTALTSWEIVLLLNPTNAGESSVGAFFYWGNGGAGDGYHARFDSSLNAIYARVYNTGNTPFDTTTSAGLAAATWQLLFISFDNAGDRKIHIYKGVSGAVSELSYSAQPAMTGTFKAPAAQFNWFSNTLTQVTFNGLYDEALYCSGNLSGAQRTQLALLAGV